MQDHHRLALTREAGLAGNLVGAGLAALRKANYAMPGLYSQAFFNLSIGLERFLKIIYIMDFIVENKGLFPTDDNLRTLGHDITVLFQKAEEMAKRRGVDFGPVAITQSDLEYNIIIFMSDFAKRTRYYNLNLLAGIAEASGQIDPIKRWVSDIGKVILKKHFGVRQEKKIRANAAAIETLIGNYTLVQHIAEDGTPLDSVYAASYETGKTEIIRKYGTFYCARICRYLYYILYGMRNVCLDSDIDVPFVDELFFPFMNDDAYLLSRRTFPPRGQAT